jgi:hypothetical protein
MGKRLVKSYKNPLLLELVVTGRRRLDVESRGFSRLISEVVVSLPGRDPEGSLPF